MKGFIKYLSYLFPEFNKETVSQSTATEIFSRAGIRLRPLSESALREALGEEKAKEFTSFLCYGEGDYASPSPILFFNNGKAASKVWFFLCHEFGHFCLHPFIKERLPEMSSEEKEDLLGLLEVEADHFANLFLIPDVFLNDFLEDVKKAIFNGTKADLITIKESMYEACLKRTCSLLGIDDDKIPDRAKLNLKLRVHKFISDIEEEFIIVFDSFKFSNQDHASVIRPYSKYLKIKPE